jgi:hypothetical protein
MATSYESLIPTGVASDLIATVQAQSVCMRFAAVHRMAEGVESVPVIAVEPDAEWVDP